MTLEMKAKVNHWKLEVTWGVFYMQIIYMDPLQVIC